MIRELCLCVLAEWSNISKSFTAFPTIHSDGIWLARGAFPVIHRSPFAANVAEKDESRETAQDHLSAPLPSLRTTAMELEPALTFCNVVRFKVESERLIALPVTKVTCSLGLRLRKCVSHGRRGRT